MGVRSGLDVRAEVLVPPLEVAALVVQRGDRAADLAAGAGRARHGRLRVAHGGKDAVGVRHVGVHGVYGRGQLLQVSFNDLKVSHRSQASR